MNDYTLNAGVTSAVFKNESPTVTYAHTMTAAQNTVKKTYSLFSISSEMKTKIRLTILINTVKSSQPKLCTTIALVQILKATVVHASDKKTMITMTVAVTSYRRTCSIAIEPTGFPYVSFWINISSPLVLRLFYWCANCPRKSLIAWWKVQREQKDTSAHDVLLRDGETRTWKEENTGID